VVETVDGAKPQLEAVEGFARVFGNGLESRRNCDHDVWQKSAKKQKQNKNICPAVA
jgi:hypothetical protein